MSNILKVCRVIELFWRPGLIGVEVYLTKFVLERVKVDHARLIFGITLYGGHLLLKLAAELTISYLGV